MTEISKFFSFMERIVFNIMLKIPKTNSPVKMTYSRTSVIPTRMARALWTSSFCVSEITELQWLELPMSQTHFDRHFKFKPPKFYCIMVQLFIIFLEYRNKTQCGQ